ncbi:hypothetical protein SASPL_134652 [Salvia splendens]|uniref:Leucine-rich repeat-containing N-terminal plant-type domain-containing protein n=1 Tax=Salvia splendens TaxID=180675 RepID=A0A8X8WWE0_SALSN|nr:hypothetical protein SASPL_134652 [Salvia splendens]
MYAEQSMCLFFVNKTLLMTVKALNEIKASLGWRVVYAWVGDDPCGDGDMPAWSGVRCSPVSGSDYRVVTEFNLRWNKLQDSITPEIGELKQLTLPILIVSLQQLKGLLGIVHFTTKMQLVPVSWRTIVRGIGFLALLLITRQISMRKPKALLGFNSCSVSISYSINDSSCLLQIQTAQDQDCMLLLCLT